MRVLAFALVAVLFIPVEIRHSQLNKDEIIRIESKHPKLLENLQTTLRI